MRPTLRLPLALLGFATCLLSQPVWLSAQAPAPPAGPPAGGRGLGRGARGGGGPAAASLPYITEHAVGGMRFDQPLGMVTAPGEPKSLYVFEKTGRIIRIPDVTHPPSATDERDIFLDLTAEIGPILSEQGLLALAFHPDYQKNHQFYVWFTTSNADGDKVYDRLARFTTGADGKADLKSEQPLISQIDRAANHNGGELSFGPDGYLYLTMGDEGGANGEWGNTQLIDKNFFSGMIRIDVDKRPGSLAPNPNPAVHPGSYAVPPDNPWVGATSFNSQPVDPKKVRTEFWAVGLRNAWRWSFDRTTGLLWLADVGQERVEAVDLIRRGGNYGWNFFESGTAYNPVPPNFSETAFGPYTPPPLDPNRAPPAGFTFDKPIYTYNHTGVPGVESDTGNCIIGGIVYRGAKLPALKEHYVFGDYVSGYIWALTPVDGKGGKVTVEKLARISGIVAFGQDPVSGDLLLANANTNPRTGGYVERLVPNPAFVPAPAAK